MAKKMIYRPLLLCENCIQAIKSHGEPVLKGELICIEDAEEKGIFCEFCKELDELFFCTLE